MERKNVIYLSNIKDRSRENNKRSISITTIFIITMLIIYGMLILICNSWQGVLWRSVYYNTILTMFWIISVIIKKPLILTFFADLDAFNGKNRKKRLEFYNSEKILPYFYGVTLFFACCSSIKAAVWFAVIMQPKLISYNLILTSIDFLTLILIALEIIAVAIVVCKVKTVEFINNNIYSDNKVVVLEHPLDV